MNWLLEFLAALAIASGFAATAPSPNASRSGPSLDESFQRLDGNRSDPA